MFSDRGETISLNSWCLPASRRAKVKFRAGQARETTDRVVRSVSVQPLSPHPQSSLVAEAESRLKERRHFLVLRICLW